jgi:hypothetical protein
VTDSLRSLDPRLTELEALAFLRAQRGKRELIARVHDKLVHVLELLAVDAVDDAIDLLKEVLLLLEAAE